MASRPKRYCSEEAARIIQDIFTNDDDENEPLGELLDDDDDFEAVDGDDDVLQEDPAQGIDLEDNMDRDNATVTDSDNPIAYMVDEYLYTLDEDVLVPIDDEFDDEIDDEEIIEHNEDLLARSGRQWIEIVGKGRENAGRAPARNVFINKPGVKLGIRPSSAKESFLLFFDDIIEDCVRYTNLEARRVIQTYNNSANLQKKWKPVDRKEMEAFIGLHIIVGALKGNYRDTLSLWSERDGVPACRATMSRERFILLKRFFRFDDRLRRDPNDPLSPVRNIWEDFSLRTKEFYTPKPCLTIDEQLLEFHGKIRFRVYISTKAGKYGIKIVWLCEADTGYALTGVPYIGETTLTEDERADMSMSEAVTIKVMKPYLNKGYNLTCDNWFTSSSLAENLESKNTTLVGTIRANRVDIPKKAKDLSGRIKKSTKYFKSGTQILVSYWDKGNKPVLVLSTQHTSAVNLDSGLPEIISCYNQTKSGVDNMDHMIRLFTCKRKCFRWTYGFLFNLVDIGLLNASIIMRNLNPPATTAKRNSFRMEFLLEAGYQLLDDHIKHRVMLKGMSAAAITAMGLLGYKKNVNVVADADDNATQRTMGRCKECTRKVDKKTTQKCTKCKNFVCKAHGLKSIVCTKCA